jgi:regulator of sigma E protease
MGIVSAIIILGVLIFVHELGHFLVAKWCGVGVLEFSIGFGPVIFKFQGGDTTYSLRAIPLGGFVRMAGDDPSLVYGEAYSGTTGEEDQTAGGASPIEGAQEQLTERQQALVADESKWFLKKSYLPRCAVVLAGPLVNFLFAWVLAFGSFVALGIPTLVDGPVTVGMVQTGFPAEQAGLHTGDQILSVDGVGLSSFQDLVKVVEGSQGKELSFAVVRKDDALTGARNKIVTIPIRPQAGESPELDVLEGRAPNKTYRIGISPSLQNVRYEPAGISTAVSAAGVQVVGMSLQTLRVLQGVVTGLLSPTKTLGGPIEIIKQTSRSVDDGLMAVITIMIMLNITLGVMNLLPIPVLDGGHLLLFTIERLKGSPLSMRVQAAATNVGLLAILALLVFATGNDLVRNLL